MWDRRTAYIYRREAADRRKAYIYTLLLFCSVRRSKCWHAKIERPAVFCCYHVIAGAITPTSKDSEAKEIFSALYLTHMPADIAHNVTWNCGISSRRIPVDTYRLLCIGCKTRRKRPLSSSSLRTFGSARCQVTSASEPASCGPTASSLCTTQK